jgi:hypothetical protein
VAFLVLLNWVILPFAPAIRHPSHAIYSLADLVGRLITANGPSGLPGAKFTEPAPVRQQPRDQACKLLSQTFDWPLADWRVTAMAPGVSHANRWQGVGWLRRTAYWDETLRYTQDVSFQVDLERGYVEQASFGSYASSGSSLSEAEALKMAADFVAHLRPGLPPVSLELDHGNSVSTTTRWNWRERNGEVYSGRRGTVDVDRTAHHVTFFSEYRPPANLIAPRLTREMACAALDSDSWTAAFRHGEAALSDFHLIQASRTAPNEGPVWEYEHVIGATERGDALQDCYDIDAVSGVVIKSGDPFAKDFEKHLRRPKRSLWLPWLD